MPGAVPHTSTYALINVTMPYALEIADSGLRFAVESDPALLAFPYAALVAIGYAVTRSRTSSAPAAELEPVTQPLLRCARVSRFAG